MLSAEYAFDLQIIVPELGAEKIFCQITIAQCGVSLFILYHIQAFLLVIANEKGSCLQINHIVSFRGQMRNKGQLIDRI